MASRFKQNMQNFFSGRNGLDELGLVCFILSIIFSILNMFFPNLVIFYITNITKNKLVDKFYLPLHINYGRNERIIHHQFAFEEEGTFQAYQ